MLRLISWNVNGIRAVYKKGFMEWFNKQQPDILCFQETRALPEQLPEPLKAVSNYNIYFSRPERSGYSGVALFSKPKPKRLERGYGIERFDIEGRVIIAHYNDFVLYNIYFPNGKLGPERLRFKLDFYKATLHHLKSTSKEQPNIVVCGDFNTAHKKEDLARPKQNENISGFLPVERDWLTKLIAEGFVDTFRIFTQGGGYYTWWDLKTRARERNVGWRIDYFFVSKSLRNKVKSAYILSEVYGSDHCPIGLELDL